MIQSAPVIWNNIKTMSVFLDHAATTVLRPSAQQAMLEAMKYLGNASSVHSAGQSSRKLLEDARDQVSTALGCHRSEVIFTSGGTESDNAAVKGIYWNQVAKSPSKKLIISSYTEHHALIDPIEWLEQHEGAEVIWLRVRTNGEVDLEQLSDLISNRHQDIALISLMWANNETGVITDIEAVTALANPFNIPVHSDAVAAVGHIDVDFATSGLSAMSVSGHKIGAPIGVGVLIVSRSTKLDSLIHGGGQERSLRSGTMNYPLALSFAAALSEAVAEVSTRQQKLSKLRDFLESEVQRLIPDVLVTASGSNRLADNSHLIFPGCLGDSLLFLLDIAGIQVSTGSACQAGVVGPSHVLLAMGHDEDSANGCIRITLGHTTEKADIDAILDALPLAYLGAKKAGLTTR